VRGSADLIAYMFLIAWAVTDEAHGHFGLLATNTVSQGDTREVGLDQIVRGGMDIYAAEKSEKWPTQGANLEYSIVWASRRHRASGVRAVADGVRVSAISPALDPERRATGNPARLAANQRLAFIGSYVLGMGFTLSEAEARDLIVRDPRNADVLFPYVNGKDLNSRPDSSASRWIINFFDWSQARAEGYPLCYELVKKQVKPERDRNNRENYRRYWWRYGEARPGLLTALHDLSHVVAIAQTSNVLLPVRIATGSVMSHTVVVFPTADYSDFALLSSSPHYVWAVAHAATMRTDLRYTPSDISETFARPDRNDTMRHAGEALDLRRREVMLDRQLGLTKTYHLVHDPKTVDVDVVLLRDLHAQIDSAVCAAYGWKDLVLNHGHYETRQGIRWTVSPTAQIELLDRLLELNHARYAEEQERLLGGKRVKSRSAVGGRAQYSADTLFDSGNTMFDTREDS
jgi:hypothetical protein